MTQIVKLTQQRPHLDPLNESKPLEPNACQDETLHSKHSAENIDFLRLQDVNELSVSEFKVRKVREPAMTSERGDVDEEWCMQCDVPLPL